MTTISTTVRKESIVAIAVRGNKVLMVRRSAGENIQHGFPVGSHSSYRTVEDVALVTTFSQTGLTFEKFPDQTPVMYSQPANPETGQPECSATVLIGVAKASVNRNSPLFEAEWVNINTAIKRAHKVGERNFAYKATAQALESLKALYGL